MTVLAHDPAVALEFLRWMYPEGPWTLTVIEPSQQEIQARTFRPAGETELRTWLRDHANWNVYYNVNRPTQDHKRAERSGIVEVAFLHVDVDPRSGEDFATEQVRIAGVMERMPPGVPPPSAVVFSGGGYNALWRLERPLPVAQGSTGKAEAEARAEDAKRYNLQLEILLSGDNCHDISRILRLPGTVNWPNERKRKKGRLPTMSRVVVTTAATYPITAFVAAAPVQARGEALAAGGGVRVAVPGNVRRLSHVSELGDKVTNRTKMLIVQGHDPDDPAKFASRSELLFHVCCELIRAEVPDEVVYAVITDPGFVISASVLDKGSSAERYALRQIQRAKEDAIDPHLRALNEKHAVIGNMGGKCRVVQEQPDHALDGRNRLTTQSFEDFRNRYMNQRVVTGKNAKTGEPTYTPLGAWWLLHPNRRQYEALAFVPGRELPDVYNLWRGFACEAKPGDRHLSFLEHVRTNVCGSVDLFYDYLIRWMARVVQRPDTQGEVAVVFRGDQGVGKGTVARELGKLLGRHFLQISDPKHLVGNFNEHLRDAVLVFADEAFYAGDKKHESILKTLITEELLVIEGKGRDVETGRNYVHLMMASNSTWVVPAGANERRYFVLDVLPARMRQAGYWDRINADLNGGGRENLLHHLLTLDLTGYDVRTVPQTDALRDQKLLSFSPEQEWWFGKLENGSLLRQHVSWTAPVFKEDLLDDYLSYMQRIGVQRRSTATALGRFIKTTMPAGWPRSKQHTRTYHNPDGVRMSERAYAYEFPPLDECRAHWDRHFGGPYPWPVADPQPNGSSQVNAF